MKQFLLRLSNTNWGKKNIKIGPFLVCSVWGNMPRGMSLTDENVIVSEWEYLCKCFQNFTIIKELYHDAVLAVVTEYK